MFLFVHAVDRSQAGEFVDFLARSPSAHVSPYSGGQGLADPECGKFIVGDPWDSDKPLDWASLGAIWRRQLKDSGRKVFVESSGPNIVRAEEIEAAFPESRHLVHMIDPYGFCGAAWLREGVSGNKEDRLALAAETWVSRAAMLRNTLTYVDQSLYVSDEAFRGSPARVADAILALAPELLNLDIFAVEDPIESGHDLTTRNRALLGREGVERINAVLADFTDSLASFGYASMSPDSYDRMMQDDALRNDAARRIAARTVLEALDHGDMAGAGEALEALETCEDLLEDEVDGLRELMDMRALNRLSMNLNALL